jgi:hypothetical protein
MSERCVECGEPAGHTTDGAILRCTSEGCEQGPLCPDCMTYHVYGLHSYEQYCEALMRDPYAEKREMERALWEEEMRRDVYGGEAGR